MRKRRAAAALLCVLLGATPAQAGKGFEQDLDVKKGARLEIDNPSGLVYIRGEERLDHMEIRVDHGDCVDVRVRTHGDVVSISPDTDCKSAVTDFDLRIPRWMPVKIEGARAEVEVRGVHADVDVDVVDGEVYVLNSEGRMFLRSVQGDIEVENCKGEFDVGSTNESIFLSNLEGQILAETLGGNLRMEGIVSRDVEAITLNGNIFYNGSMDPRGNYYFSSHDGDVEVSVPENADLTVTVASMGGEFSCDFEIRPVNTQPGKRFEFTLGSGSGKLRIESFNGDVELYDPKGGRRKRGR